MQLAKQCKRPKCHVQQVFLGFFSKRGRSDGDMMPTAKSPRAKSARCFTCQQSAASQHLAVVVRSFRKLRMQMFNEIDLNHSNKLSLGEVSAAMEKILEEAGQVSLDLTVFSTNDRSLPSPVGVFA